MRNEGPLHTNMFMGNVVGEGTFCSLDQNKEIDQPE